MDIKNFIHDAIIIVLSIIIGVSGYHVYTSYSNKSTPVVSDATGIDIDSSYIKSVTNGTDSQVENIVKQINTAKSGKVDPVKTVYSSRELTSKEISSTVSDAGVKATSIVKQTTKDTGKDDSYTTNVYAIDATKKAQHGVGVYMRYSGASSSKYSAGITYRNKRVLYGVGIDKNKKLEGFLGYEIAQW